MSTDEQFRIPQEVLGFLCPGTAPRDGAGPLPPEDSLCLLSQFRRCQEAGAGRLDVAPDMAVHSPCCFPAPKLERQEFSLKCLSPLHAKMTQTSMRSCIERLVLNSDLLQLVPSVSDNPRHPSDLHCVLLEPRPSQESLSNDNSELSCRQKGNSK